MLPNFARRWTLLLLLLIYSAQYQALLDPRPGSEVNWWSAGAREQQQQQRLHGKEGGPKQAFTGGSGLNNNRVVWCDSPTLPGCQACPDPAAGCAACWAQFPDATGAAFVFNPTTKQCDCPPGYGRLPEPQPATWSGRHLLTDSSNASTAAAAGSNYTLGAEATSPILAELLGQPSAPEWQAAGGTQWGLQLPPWALSCLPCPVDHYSPGGQQGFAQCRPCPGSYTTAGAKAAANCMYPYCGPGQEPTRRTGRCRPCPFGTYSGATANNRPCYPCPANWTTPAAGSTSYRDCRVQICQPGQQLDLDTFVCKTCTGNTVSPGGVRANGPYQPLCKECPFGAAANQTRSVCYPGVCPYPANFAINCRKSIPLGPAAFYQCGPGAKSVSINEYCTAYPVGSQLAVVRYVPNTPDALAAGTSLAAPTKSVVFNEIPCPAGANASNVVLPVIVSYNGRTDCACDCSGTVGSTTPCAFASSSCIFSLDVFGSQTAGSSVYQPFYITIPDPQLDSLKTLVQSMAGSNDTRSYAALRYGYCVEQAQPVSVYVVTATTGLGIAAWTNPLQVNCSGSYVTRVALSIDANATSWVGNGRLPSAIGLAGLSQLRSLTCSNCSLAGSLPRDWGTSRNLMELRYLDLGGNGFTGTLPETWGYLVNLVNLTLSSSEPLGQIPTGWGHMRSLAFVNLTALQLDTTACAPMEWSLRNGLVVNDTLLPPSSLPTLSFCG